MTNRKLIYLASPYSHEDGSVVEARYSSCLKAAARIMETTDLLVFSPILHSHHIERNWSAENHGDRKTGFDYWKDFDLRMLRHCDELWVLMLHGFQSSRGIAEEIKYAAEIETPVYFVEPGSLEHGMDIRKWSMLDFKDDKATMAIDVEDVAGILERKARKP